MLNMVLNIFTDGGSRGNPGLGAIGVVIKDEAEKVIGRVSKRIGQVTNNVAEYTAVAEALQYVSNQYSVPDSGSGSVISKEKIEKIQFFLDSTLVVNQLNGLFKIKDSNLRTLLLRVRELEQKVGGNVSYTHIPREKNWEADLLVNHALDSP